MRRLGSWTARDDKGRSGALVGRGGRRGGVERRGVWVSGDDHRRRVVAGHGGAGELGGSRKERRSAGRLICSGARFGRWQTRATVSFSRTAFKICINMTLKGVGGVTHLFCHLRLQQEAMPLEWRALQI